MKKSKVVRMTEAGFTLVELMIVVAIIGILAAIAIPNFQKYQAKARQKESHLALSGIYTAETSNQGEFATYTGCLANAGYQPDGVITGPGGRRNYAAGVANALCTGPTWGGPAAATCSMGGAAVGCGTAGFNTNINAFANQYGATAQAGTAAGAGGAQAALATGFGLTATTFTAGAAGSIARTTAAVYDTWSIDQNKTIVNTISGL